MAERYEDQYRDRGRRDDRGFIERAGDEVRSWFGDDDAERRRQMDDRDRDRDRFRDQLYGQNPEYRRGYGDRSYGDRSYENRGYGDRNYEDRGFSDRGYGYGPGAADRSWGQGNYRGQEGYRGGQGYGSDDRSGSGRSPSYSGSGFRGAGEGYGTYSGSSSGYGSGYRSDYGRGSGSGFSTGSFAGPGERQSGSYGGRFGFGEHEMGYSGRGPKGYQRSDSRINEDVCDRLCDAPDIDASNIEVVVNQGEVTLSGSVNDRDAKHRAEDLAESVSGVRDVCNNLRVNRGQDAGTGSSSITGTSGRSVGASSGGTSDVAHPGITGGGPSGATNISTSQGAGGAAGVPENPLGLRENADTKTSTAGGRR